MIKPVVNVMISNLEGNFEKDFWIVSKITNFIPSKMFKINMPELTYIKLANENLNLPGHIDMF